MDTARCDIPLATPLQEALFSFSPVPLWVWDRETFRFLEVNDAAVRSYGFSREEFLRIDIFAIRPPEVCDSVRQSIAERGPGNRRHEVYVHQTKSGERFHAEITAHEISFEGRLAVLVAAVDVTHRVLLEQELCASRLQFQRLADQAPVAIWTSDLDGNCLFTNHYWLEWRGRTLQEEREGAWIRDMHAEDLWRYRHIALEAMKRREPYSLEYRMRNHDGEFRDLLERGRPFFTNEGLIDGFIGTCTDVTELKRAEAELTRHRELLQTTFDAVPAMIEVLDEEGRLLFGNAEFERVLGWTVEEIQAIQARGESFTALVFPDPAERQRMLDHLLRSEGAWGEFHPRARDGRALTITWTAVRLSDGKAIGIGQCVTAQRSLEEELRQTHRMESLGRLAGGVAHDFNNILTALLGYTDIALGQSGDNPKLGRSLVEIRKAGERATALTSQLLALSRKQVLTPQPIDLGAIIRDVAAMLRRLIGEDIVLHTEIEEAIPPVLADRVQIEQVLLNLVVNARDAMPRGGDLRIALRTVAEEHSPVPGTRRVLLEVVDSGHGMQAEVKRQIFDPFFTTKPAGEGTGLGLSTVYGIVRQAGGSIDVESEPGKGSAFRLSFPTARGAEQVPPQPAACGTPVGRSTILLVEDDAMVRDVTSEMLRLGGHIVVGASSGADAIALLERGDAVDLVVSDLVMPGMSGWELRERASQLLPSLPFIFISGFAADDIARRGILTEGVAFLPKPFRAYELYRRVNALLAPSHQGQP